MNSTRHWGAAGAGVRQVDDVRGHAAGMIFSLASGRCQRRSASGCARNTSGPGGVAFRRTPGPSCRDRPAAVPRAGRSSCGRRRDRTRPGPSRGSAHRCRWSVTGRSRPPRDGAGRPVELLTSVQTSVLTSAMRRRRCDTRS